MSHLHPGWARRNKLTEADLERVAGSLPDIHSIPEQPIQGGSPGEHFHLTAAEHAFLADLVANGIPFPEIRIYEPVAAAEEILFSEETGDCLMAWGGEIQEINPETEGVIEIPEGSADERFTWSVYIPAREPGSGASALNTQIFLVNWVTGVSSPIPAFVTFTLRVTAPALFSGDKVISYTTPEGGTTNYSVIASLLAEFPGTGLGGLGFSTAFTGENSFRLYGPPATFVGRGLSSAGDWRLVESIASAGSPGVTGNNKYVFLELDPTATYTPGEWLVITVGTYQFAYQVLPGQSPTQIMQGLVNAVNAADDDFAASMYYGATATFGALSGIYGTHPWVDYTPVLTIAPAE